MTSICVVTQQYEKVVSGIGLHTQLLVSQLVKDSHCVTVVAPANQRPPGNLPFTFVGVPFPVFSRSQARWFSLSWSFARALTKLGDSFDIIHFTDAREAFFYHNSSKQVAVIGNVNDTYAAESAGLAYYRRHYADWLTRWCYYQGVRWCEQRTLPRLQACIANSQYTAKVLRDQYQIAPQRLHVCYKAINPDYYASVLEIRKNQYPTSARRVLFVGGNMQRKGLPVLIQSAPYVLDVLPETEFWIVGEDRFMPRMRDFCHSLGVESSFRFLGWKSRHEILEIYAQVDIFVMPSLVEALGVVFLEAMACGLPVIGTSVGGIPELITHDYNGLLVKPGDPIDLAQALILLLSDKDLRLKLVEGGLKVAHQFNVEQMIDCTYKLYNTFLNRELY